MLNREERRRLSRENRRWLRAVNRSDLDPETKDAAAWLAARANPDGTITDPQVVRMLNAGGDDR